MVEEQGEDISARICRAQCGVARGGGFVTRTRAVNVDKNIESAHDATMRGVGELQARPPPPPPLLLALWRLIVVVCLVPRSGG